MVIATPPHWHALPFIEACRRGLDIYCEKPLAYDVREGRAMVDAAKASGRVVQVGFQRRHSAAIRQARQYIAEGNAGRIVTVAAQIHYPAQLADPTPQDPPATLDWDLWCGPAPKLPYSPQVGHFNWRAEEAYGNGHLVDWGIHWIDAIRVVLGLGMPRSVQSAGGLYAAEGPNHDAGRAHRALRVRRGARSRGPTGSSAPPSTRRRRRTACSSTARRRRSTSPTSATS